MPRNAVNDAARCNGNDRVPSRGRTAPTSALSSTRCTGVHCTAYLPRAPLHVEVEIEALHCEHRPREAQVADQNDKDVAWLQHKRHPIAGPLGMYDLHRMPGFSIWYLDLWLVLVFGSFVCSFVRFLGCVRVFVERCVSFVWWKIGVLMCARRYTCGLMATSHKHVARSTQHCLISMITHVDAETDRGHPTCTGPLLRRHTHTTQIQPNTLS